MAVAQNWLHIRRHFVQRLASQIVDEQHIVACCNHPFHQMINVNERDAIKVQNIRLHHLNNLMEIGVRPMVHWLMLFAMVLGIMLAQNLFVIVEIIPEKNKKI